MMDLLPWMGFIAFVLVMLFIDLGIFNKDAHVVSVKEAMGWSVVWFCLAIGFGLIILKTRGPEDASLFFSAYIVEKALSVDNLFVFIMIFSYLKIPSSHQHKILFYGILGALVMRAVFIFAGIGLISKFSWLLYLFGVFLIYTGCGIMRGHDGEDEGLENNKVYNWLKKRGNFTDIFHGDHFRTPTGLFTPMFLCLILVEVSDVIFAVDSIPAVIGITHDPYIVFTSNVFAILGLRSLYFALDAMASKLYYLKHGLSIILVFIGCKMVLADVFHFPVWVTLSVISVTLSLCAIFSYRKSVEAV